MDFQRNLHEIEFDKSWRLHASKIGNTHLVWLKT